MTPRYVKNFVDPALLQKICFYSGQRPGKLPPGRDNRFSILLTKSFFTQGYFDPYSTTDKLKKINKNIQLLC